MTLNTEVATSLSRHSRRPEIAVCFFDKGAEAWDLVEDLSGEPWSVQGTQTLPVALGDDPEALVTSLLEQMRSHNCRAVLLVGLSRKSTSFRLQMRAENRGLDLNSKASLTCPGLARTTAPVADMLSALKAAGLAAEATSEAEDDVGSYLMYRLLSEQSDIADTPVVGLLRVPVSSNENTVRQGVKATMTAIARNLTSQPRTARG